MPAGALSRVRFRWAWIWTLAAALAILACSFVPVFNGDLWFHLAAGRWMLEHEAVPAVDSWSFTAAGRPWHDHEWLAQLLLEGWAEGFGLGSLMIWKWLLLLATFLLLLRLLQRLGGSYAAAFLALLFALRMAQVFFEIRPHLWSLLFTVLVLQLVLLREGPRWLLPLLFALWANLHGGVVFGLLLLCTLLAVEAAAEWPQSRWQGLRRPAATALLCLGATLLNPYGPGVLTYPLRLAPARSATRELLTEWLSPFDPRGLRAPLFSWGILVLVAAAVLLVRGASWRERRRESWSALAVAALTLAMAVASRRFIPLFAIALSLVVALAAAPLTPLIGRLASSRRMERAPRWLGPPLRAAPPVAALVAGVLLLRPWQLPADPFLATTLSGLLPVAALDLATGSGLRGGIFAFYPWGGYVDWRTDGQLPVFVDGRADTVFDDSTVRAYARVQHLEPGWEHVIEDSGARLVLWPRLAADQGTVVRQLTMTGRWLRLHEDPVAVLLVRRGAPLPQHLVLPPLAAGHQLIARAMMPGGEP